MYRIIWKDISEIDNCCFWEELDIWDWGWKENVFSTVYPWGVSLVLFLFHVLSMAKKKKINNKKMQNTTQDFKEIPVDSVETGVRFLYL